MTAKFSRAELVERMVKAGEAEVSGAPPEEIASYFDTKTFRFHGPDVTDSKSCGPGGGGGGTKARGEVARLFRTPFDSKIGDSILNRQDVGSWRPETKRRVGPPPSLPWAHRKFLVCS